MTAKLTTVKDFTTSTERRPAYNSGLAKVAVLWLIEQLCFVSSSVVADSFVLRNRHLRQAANRYLQGYDDSANSKRQC